MCPASRSKTFRLMTPLPSDSTTGAKPLACFKWNQAGSRRSRSNSMCQGDLRRRAMGKKDKEKMAKERANFIAGCARTNEIGEKKANAIFDLLEKFAGYGFNKSHSAAYALISYQTAFLKANHPV